MTPTERVKLWLKDNIEAGLISNEVAGHVRSVWTYLNVNGPALLDIPHAGVAPDDVVLLKWENDVRHCIFDIFPDGEVEFFAVDMPSLDTNIYCADYYSSESPPEAVFENLKRAGAFRPGTEWEDPPKERMA